MIEGFSIVNLNFCVPSEGFLWDTIKSLRFGESKRDGQQHNCYNDGKVWQKGKVYI